ncbi:MAG: 16S rRNA (uracil(1498)-N(3))-methyltransferase [Cyanobium sp.]
MPRELRRLLIEPNRLSGVDGATKRVTLKPEEAHYLARVLRLRPGDPVEVVDGCGSLWRARRGEGDWLEELVSSGPRAEPLSPRLNLALALPRQEVEVVWRMACELGIDRLQPLRSERSQASGRREPVERWQALLREATEQCERLWLPTLESPRPAMHWWSDGKGWKLLATTRCPGIAALETALDQLSRDSGLPEEIRLAIGPEGGWSPAEEAFAEAQGWRPVCLGTTILRSGTAAVAGASRLVAWRELSCAASPGPSHGIHPDRPHCDDAPEGGHRRP